MTFLDIEILDKKAKKGKGAGQSEIRCKTALQFDSFTKKMWSHFSSFACNNVDCGLVQSEESEAAACEKPKNINKSKNCQNFKPCFSWVLSHLPWFVMHHNQSNHVGYYHVQGFQG